VLDGDVEVELLTEHVIHRAEHPDQEDLAAPDGWCGAPVATGDGTNRRADRCDRHLSGVGLDMTTDRATLGDLARHLRDLHCPGDPLILVNAWDVASALVVQGAGARAIATSSAAIAASTGEPDDDSMDVEVVFEVIRRIATATSLPVTADIEAGYGLDAVRLVDRLLDAGAVGCNVEDSDHRRPGAQVASEVFAERLAAIRAAAGAAGVDIVLNARIDTFLLGGSGPPSPRCCRAPVDTPRRAPIASTRSASPTRSSSPT
jgi:Phosphoenolpyruvate phosphomutase